MEVQQLFHPWLVSRPLTESEAADIELVYLSTKMGHKRVHTVL